MGPSTTELALASVTDEGLFERLAAAVLREAVPAYARLVHTGLNASGKTIKSPVDGIAFVPGADPPHMIAVHHTTSARAELRRKWLHDPSKANGRGVIGDLVKTAALAAEERKRVPALRVSLVLTTNQEPGEDLVRDVEAAARENGLEVDLWSRSRLAHFLDINPSGQWVRRQYLSIEQEQLSVELLRVLSERSLAILEGSLGDDPGAWIPCETDDALASSLARDVSFLVAGSGLGKSVACYRRMRAHASAGGLAFMLTHDVVANAATLDEALTETLWRLHPSLLPAETSPLSFGTPEQPILMVVEDVNRSGQASMLTEKIASWGQNRNDAAAARLASWRLMCPLWPEVFATLREQGRKRVERLSILSGSFTSTEGREAVLARARLCGRSLSLLEAEEISTALGHDPLLIALHEFDEKPEALGTIGRFVDHALERIGAQEKWPAVDFMDSLRVLAGEMLVRRQFELSWLEVRRWPALAGQPLILLAALASRGEVIRLTGSADSLRLQFRHDRVRDWLLVDAAATLNVDDLLTDDVVAEPYFAEVLGAVLAQGSVDELLLRRIITSNPLALFHALRLLGESSAVNHQRILEAIDGWLDEPESHARFNRYLRWEALTALSESDSSQVPRIVMRLSERTIAGHLARLRNGDVGGGIELCRRVSPGHTAPWRDAAIEHAKLRLGSQLTDALCTVLAGNQLTAETREGALLLAGHLADPRLASSLQSCWGADAERATHLADYLWAFTQCCGSDADRYLAPVCDEWAKLPDIAEEGHDSPRVLLGAYELRWALIQWPPRSALRYLVKRGSEDELRRPMTVMLQGVDDPEAVRFVLNECAALACEVAEAGSFSPFLSSVTDDWRRAEEERGRRMSEASRDLALGLWQDEANDKYLRSQAFLLWAATHAPDDVDVLREVRPPSDLGDKVLWARLDRRDVSAIPELLERLEGQQASYWWQCGRKIWSPDLSDALDAHLGWRRTEAAHTWNEWVDADWITSELVTRLPADEAESLLLTHWDHLRFSSEFVKAALFVSAPSLLKAVSGSIDECPEPKRLLEGLSRTFGIRMEGHAGPTREVQISGVVPFLDLLNPHDLWGLWDACNTHGWFQLRRDYLDELLEPPYRRGLWNPDEVPQALDTFVAEKHTGRIDHWIDTFLATGTPWSEILRTIETWADKRRSMEALELLAAAVVHQGSRSDLVVLDIHKVIPDVEAEWLTMDAVFAVRRRSMR